LQVIVALQFCHRSKVLTGVKICKAMQLSSLPHTHTHTHTHTLRTFLQVGDPVVQRGERGLHPVPLVGVVPGGGPGLLHAVDPGQNLLLHVVHLVLEEIFQAVGRPGAVGPAVLLHGTQGHTHRVKGEHTHTHTGLKGDTHTHTHRVKGGHTHTHTGLKGDTHTHTGLKGDTRTHTGLKGDTHWVKHRAKGAHRPS